MQHRCTSRSNRPEKPLASVGKGLNGAYSQVVGDVDKAATIAGMKRDVDGDHIEAGRGEIKAIQ